MRKIDVYARFAPLFLMIALLFVACGSSSTGASSGNGQNGSSCQFHQLSEACPRPGPLWLGIKSFLFNVLSSVECLSYQQKE
jgi:hypothetical protein